MPGSVTAILWAFAGMVSTIAMVFVGFWLYTIATTSPVGDDEPWGM